MMDEQSPKDEFIEQINKTYKSEGIADVGNNLQALNLPRFSSGILSLDCALGGGWPFGRIAIIAGMESTGKTLTMWKDPSMWTGQRLMVTSPIIMS